MPVACFTHMSTHRNFSGSLAGLMVAAVALSGCVASYPNGTPIAGAYVSANPVRPGTADFCRVYARQTAGNSYENLVDRGEDSFGARFIKEQSARQAGSRAYRRCLAGRTN